jgi:indole-3-glycerol phosphate synthase
LHPDHHGLVEDGLAAELEDAARHWGMDALIEVHDGAELDRALRLKSPLIGINNRDLNTFETTLETTKTLAPRVPEGRMVISESGLFTPADLAEMAGSGARSFLIGESLMRQADVAGATRALLANPSGASHERQAHPFRRGRDRRIWSMSPTRRRPRGWPWPKAT